MANHWVPVTGATLLMPSGPTTEHMFVIMAGPTPLKNYGTNKQFISVNISSIYPGVPFDEACILEPGAHPFVKHPSYAAYRHARIDAQQHLEKMVRDGVWKPHRPCSAGMFEKIMRGAFVSRLISREIRAFLGER
ncbi:MAG: hypothetical protein WA134_11045 [Rhodoferax sp.]